MYTCLCKFEKDLLTWGGSRDDFPQSLIFKKLQISENLITKFC